MRKIGAVTLENKNTVENTIERPNYQINGKIKIYSNVDDSIVFNHKVLNELSKFYCENNENSNGCVTKLTPEDIKKYLDMNSIIIVGKKNKKIVSSMIGMMIPTRINLDIDIPDVLHKSKKYLSWIPHKNDDKDIILPHTTFLNSHKKYRGTGLGSSVVQRSLQYNYDNGSLFGYFLNSSPRSNNAITINLWSYPTNTKKLDKLNIYYDKRYNYITSLPKLQKNILVTQSNSEEALELYKSLVKDKKLYFNPDINYWNKLINSFNTYMVNINGKNIGIFTIFKHNTYIKSKKCFINYGNKFLCVGQQPETINSLLYQAKENDYDIMHLQEVGDLNIKLLRNINALKTKGKDYLNFYNFNVKFSPHDLYVPTL